MSEIRIVMYHYVRDLVNGRYKNIKGLDTELFREQLLFFKNNFNIIRMEDLISAAESKSELPEKALLLTFDDGYADHFNTVFPVLSNMNIQGSFFIPAQTFCENTLLDVNKIHFILASGNIDDIYDETIKLIEDLKNKGTDLPPTDDLIKEYAIPNRFDNAKTIFVKRMLQTVLPEDIRISISSLLFKKYVGFPEDVFARELYMTKDQILCMKNNGMFIGFHGYNHYWLGRLSKDKQKSEILKALAAMGPFVDENNLVMNYPYGSYNDDTKNILQELNFKLGLTTKVDICNTTRDNRFELPRLDTNDFPPKSENYLNFEVKNAINV